MARILVIEDNPANFKLAAMVLNMAGHNAIWAQDAPAGFDQMRKDPPDLILLDIQLPGMDGVDAAKKIKADPLTRAIPLIALTARAMKGDEDVYREAGFDAFLPKPYSHSQLTDLVSLLLPSRMR